MVADSEAIHWRYKPMTTFSMLMAPRKTRKEGNVVISGKGLKSQKEWVMEGEALVTDVPITFLGFVNRETGTIEEESTIGEGDGL